MLVIVRKATSYLCVARMEWIRSDTNGTATISCYHSSINSEKKFDEFDSTLNDRVLDQLTVASWCDGDLAQVASIIDDLSVFDEHKIIANKQSASRSGVEQAADAARVFPILKKLSNTVTVSDISSEIFSNENNHRKNVR